MVIRGPASAPARRLHLGWWRLALAGMALLAAAPARGQSEPALIKPLAPRSLLLDGAVADGLLVVVGERGHILVSRDQGESWQQASVPVRATLTGVFFHDSRLGWAVGHDAVILRTRDGGESWELLHRAPEEERPFLDVWFRDAENGFAIGAYGYFLKTADGGDTWSQFEIETPEDSTDDFYVDELGGGYHLNHISRSASGRLYIAAEAGAVYRSDDGGETWVSLPSPYEGSFFGTLPLEGDALLLFGLRGHLFRSEDAGESWRAIDTATTAMLTDALVLADGSVVVAGLAGTLLLSTDGGETFTLKQEADRRGVATILQVADGSLVLIGEHGAKRTAIDALGAKPAF